VPKPTHAERSPKALSHPVWWTALALLLANDHVLKGAGVLPAALTGKLSDFAGMIVAPPLVALALLRVPATWRTRALVSTSLPGVVLCAIKLSPQAAHALEAGFGWIGLPWRIWLDASDLWALLALPFGYAMSLPSPQPDPSALEIGSRIAHGRRRELAHGLGIAIASLACIATGLGKKDSHSDRTDAPTIQNKSSHDVTVVLASTEGNGGCRIYRDDRIGLLNADAFTSAREIVIQPDDEAALVADTSTSSCGAASIALANGQQQLVFWRDLDKIEGFVPDDDDERRARRILLDGNSDHYTFAIGDDLKAFELGVDAPKPTCDASDVEYTLEFDELPVAQAFLQLGEQHKADDGCLEVEWFMAEGDTTPKTQRLCVPEWAFPFQENDTLAVTQSATSEGARVLRITHYDHSSIATQLEIWNDASTFEGGKIKSLEAIDCVGELAQCGAYLRPVQAALRGSSKLLHAGDDHTINTEKPDDGDPKSVRVALGNARDVSWTAPACTGGEARIGATSNALELRTY
jgi:hypothetical protein